MSSPVLSAEGAAPLLLELARALRARHFYPSTHATFCSALRRAAVAWRDALSHAGQVEILVGEAGMTLADGAPVRGLGLEEFAEELQGAGIRYLGIRDGVTPDEITTLIDTLVDESGNQIPEGGFEKLLRAYQVKHLTTQAPEGQPDATQARPEPRAETDFEPRTASPAAQQAVPPETRGLSENTVELVRLLAQLELAADLGEYRLVANRIDSVLNKLLAAKNFVDAYRAALVYCRHSADASGWTQAICEEAKAQLSSMHQNSEMLDFVLERACAPTGLTSVQAIQVLTAVGPLAVPSLLAQHDSSESAVQKQTIGILIAMGEEALPALIEELASGQAPRVRRATRLLGDMQNPRAVEFLADILQGDDLSCRREAVRSLSRIGNSRALEIVAKVLTEDSEIAPVAASCLAASTSSVAVRALTGVIGEGADVPEELRLEAIRGLGRIGSRLAVPALGELLERKPFFGKKKLRDLRVAAAHSLGQIGGEAAYMAVQPHSGDTDAEVSRACQQALRQMSQAGEE
jgi:HEAT repeat protein